MSGPLRDRIDLTVDVSAVPWPELTTEEPATESSATVREPVAQARERQRQRLQGTGLALNARLSGRLLRRDCHVDATSLRLLEKATTRLTLSARGYDRVLKVARTIADLDGRDALEARDVAEALQFRLVE